jgi:hypothetical protein
LISNFFKILTNQLLCITVMAKLNGMNLRAHLNGLETGGRLTRGPV